MNHKNQQPHYGMRKLSVGFVSCLLGFTLIAGLVPGTVYASGAKKPSKRSSNRTIVEHQVLGHHGSGGKIDVKSSKLPKKKPKGELGYHHVHHWIEWNNYNGLSGEKIDEVWIGSVQLGKVNHLGHWKDIVNYPNGFYYDEGIIYLGKGVDEGDTVKIVINGKSYRFERTGKKTLTPLEGSGEEELLQVKEAANKDIDNLSNLDEKEKKDFKNKIDQAKNEQEINTIVDQAKKQNVLNEKKKSGKKDIDNLPNLDEKEKKDFKNKIDQAKNEQEINTIVDQAKKQNVLNKKKKSGKKDIDNLSNLDEKEKKDFKNKIDQAKKEQDINTIVDQGKKRNDEKALESKKSEAKNDIDNLPNLEEKEKKDFENQIDQASDQGTVDKIVNDAKAKAEDALKQAKEAAKKEVENLPYLSKQTKDGFKDQIDKATTKEKVKELVEQAQKENAEAEKALNEKKKSGKNDIDNLPNLDEKEKKDFKNQIDQASDQGTVDKIVNDAKAKAEDALKQAKEAAKKEVENLPYLSKQRKDDFKDQIEKATTKGEVDDIVIKAKKQNAEAEKALNEKKKSGKNDIDNLPNLNEDEKKGFKDKIDQASDKDAVDKIVNDAKAKAEDALKQAKEAAKKEVENLPYLSKQTKDDFKSQVDKAGTVGEVDNIVIKAKEQNAEAKKALDEKKESGKKEIDNLPNLNEDKKEDFKDKIDEASDEGTVDKIVNEAKEKNKKSTEDEDLADLDEVNKAKKELKTYMKSMDEKVLDSESIEFKGNDRKDAKDAVQKAKDLLAKEKITKKELKFIQSIPYREENGKKSGLFREFTKKAPVNYKVEGDRDQINPHNNKKYVALKNNEIKIQSNLKGAKKIGENEKAFFKLNYVTNEQYAAHNNVAKPMAVSFRSAQVDAASTATPKYKKQEVPRENYEVKAVDGGYEITIKQLPENVKYIKPIVYVKLANKTYFENGDMVAVTAAVEPNSEDQTPGGQTPGGQTPGGQTPGGQTPGGQTPGGQTPGGQTPGGQTPGGQTPGGQTPGGQTPGDQTPGDQTPGGQTPGGQTPGGQTPGGQTPGGQNPGDQTPGGQTPGGQTPGGQTPVIPSKPDVSHESGSSSTDSGYIFLQPVATVQRESSKPSEPTKQAEAPKTKHGAYIYGYGDDCFRPNGKISRAEAASMIAYLAGLDMNQKDKANFADTPSAWYNAAINAMVKNNLMLADKDGNFRPNEPITRAEFARALAGIDKKSDRVASFTDVKGHEFEDAINQAFGNGHIVGYPDGTFRPDGAITRAEAVTILNHFDERSMDKHDLQKIRMNFKSFKDVEERHWAYVQILLAANNFQEMKDALGNR